MAPSSGHLLVPKAIKVIKYAVAKTSALIRSKLPAPSATNATVSIQPIPIRLTRPPIHPVAFLRQSRSQPSSRWFSTVQNFSSPRGAVTISRASLPVSKVSKTIVRQGGAPFSSALRPNLTGGCLPRSAGGYSIGAGGRSGVRHFSHIPASQAQVVHNVSSALRAFCLNGQKARYDGIDPRTGEKRWRAVSSSQDKALMAMSKAVTDKHVRGTTIEFNLTPTVTALSPFPKDTQSLTGEGVLSGLAVDFARALKDLSATLADLKRLAVLGDLPLSISQDSKLEVRFPGCDAKTVGTLCDELGVQRGVIKEDEAWEEDKEVQMALLFPFAPSHNGSEFGQEDALFSHKAPMEEIDWKAMMSSPSAHNQSPGFSHQSIASEESFSDFHAPPESWADAEGYESGNSGTPVIGSPELSSGSQGYEGVEGIYRFLAECDGVRR